MKTGSGIEIPPRLQVTAALMAGATLGAALCGAIAWSSDARPVVWVPIVGVLVVVAISAGVANHRLGAEVRRAAKRERERQGWARGELDWSWSMHQLQMAALTLMIAAQVAGLFSGDTDWIDGLFVTALAGLLVYVSRSAYLRRRREQRQAAATVDGEVGR